MSRSHCITGQRALSRELWIISLNALSKGHNNKNHLELSKVIGITIQSVLSRARCITSQKEPSRSLCIMPKFSDQSALYHRPCCTNQCGQYH